MIPSHVIAFLILLYGITIAVNLAVQQIGRAHYSRTPDRIWDVMWEYGPDMHAQQFAIQIIPFFLFVSLFFINKGDSILLEFLMKFILILLVRAITTVSTIFPKEGRCDDEITWATPFNGGCYDKVFSAHTAIVTLFTLIFWREKVISTETFWGLNIAQMGLIVLTRAHYTVDVILGFIITYLVYDGKYSVPGLGGLTK
jgi:hypothetical protein